MALSQDQDDELTKSLKGQFDANTMGPNLDSTLKTTGTMPAVHAPVSMADIPPAAQPMPTPVAPPVPSVDTATDDEDDDETRKGNPKVASSHPGFNQDELEKYLLKQKGDIDKYGADQQRDVASKMWESQHGPAQAIAGLGAGVADGIMQGVARAGNPGWERQQIEKQQKNMDTVLGEGKNLNEANMAAQKAKMGLDTQSSQNPLGQATADAMLPMLKQIYPGKTDAEYMAMARNPAVAESLLPEGVKLKDAEARLEDARAQRNIANEMRRESLDMHRDQNYKIGLEKDTSGLDKDANFVKAQGTVDKLGTAQQLLEAGNVNNASAKQALQTALTFVATGGQRVNETEMKQLGGAHTVTNRVGQWIQGLDKGTLTPKDYADMKQVIGIYQRGAQQAMEQHIVQKAAERAQRERISPEQARRELGHEPATPTPTAPQITPDVEAYAQKHGITPQQALDIKMKRTGGR